ncbi:MAG: alpha/beta fold hydrolase [Herpetosiphonaceae bacterium]|nr:alpha/beta fold hydrolase [Herpetosiphonaceae bacterium]
MKDWLAGIGLGFAGAELSAALLGWRGMTVLDDKWGKVAAVITCVGASGLVARSRPQLVAVSIVAGSIVHTAAALWRRRNLSPHAFFAPGPRSHYQVERTLIPLVDGELPGVLFEPPDACEAVVVMHGAGSNKASYTWPLIEGLLAAGYAVLTIDLDGHGENERVLDFPQVLDNPRVAVATLRERYATVGLVGISMGGCLAARAVAEGLAVDYVVLISAPIHVNYTTAVVRREYLTVLQPAAWHLHRHAGTLPLMAMWKEPAGTHAVDVLTMIDLLDLAGSVKQIRCPLLLIYAGLDLIAPAEHGKRLVEQAPRAMLVVIPGATHLSVSLDGRAIKALVRWLAQQGRNPTHFTPSRVDPPLADQLVMPE